MFDFGKKLKTFTVQYELPGSNELYKTDINAFNDHEACASVVELYGAFNAKVIYPQE